MRAPIPEITRSRLRARSLKTVMWLLAMGILLYAACTWAQTGVEPEFVPTNKQKFAPRAEPAKPATGSNAILMSKGYIEIGNLFLISSDLSNTAEKTRLFREAIFRSAAKVGGDLVLIVNDGVIETSDIATGKNKKLCVEYKPVVTPVPNISTSGTHTEIKSECVAWEMVPETEKKKSLVTSGSVWRYEPKLAAETAAKLRPGGTASTTLSCTTPGRIAAVKVFLQSGAPIDGFDPDPMHDGITALSSAAKAGEVESAELLLDHGADVNAVNNSLQFPYTPMAQALHSQDGGPCQAAMVRFLFAHGAILDVDGLGLDLNRHGEVGLLSDLLSTHVADVNRQDKSGQTGLMHAGFRCDRSAVKTLLSWGAAKHIKDKDGNTAADLAKLGRKRKAGVCKDYDKKDFEAFLQLLQ